jgi:hypothetical protein
MHPEPGDNYNPLIVYIDCSPKYYRRMGAVEMFKELKKPVNAFLDWVVPRFMEIDSIQIGTIKQNRNNIFSLNTTISGWSLVNEFVDIITWTLKHDPIYSSVAERLTDNISIISDDAYSTINNNKWVLFNLNPPDVIITKGAGGHASNFHEMMKDDLKVDLSNVIYFTRTGQFSFN